MKTKSALVLLLSMFLTLMINAQDAQSQKKNERRDLVKELNMSPEQEKEYIQLKEKRRNSTRELQENISSLRKEMRIAMKDESSSKDQIFSYVDKISVLKAQVQKEKIEFLFGMKQILTPEQFTQMKNIQAEKRNRKPGDKKYYGTKKSNPKKY